MLHLLDAINSLRWRHIYMQSRDAHRILSIAHVRKSSAEPQLQFFMPLEVAFFCIMIDRLISTIIAPQFLREVLILILR